MTHLLHRIPIGRKLRSIVRPLKQALHDIQNREGDLTQRLAVPGSDELSQLYHAFNEIYR